MKVIVSRYLRLRWRAEAEIPGMRVVLHKQSTMIKVIHLLMRVLSMGRFDPSRFTTTINKTMYVPNGFFEWSDLGRYTVLRHELVHMRQFRQWPFKFLDLPVLRWVNTLIFGVCYLLVLPVRHTLRAKFEREAYTQTLLVQYEVAGRYTEGVRALLARNMGRNFGGPAYLFMWNRKDAEDWAERTMDHIENGEITNLLDRVDLG